MDCCGRTSTRIELKLHDEPVTLYRCSECDTTRWVREDGPVALPVVLDIMRQSTEDRPLSGRRHEKGHRGHR